ncbi:MULTISPECIES: peptidase U32 family protein [unclassified Shewanella]|uniref:peptidase U32 family protein n=1 Tax=unclassified Shewanella TaxID=196818 RepID=UPI000C7B1602|nr:MULTISPECIES: peptidase U32 family protein [unclassified Shewanella]PKG57978.1 collagenase-like protease [Shewanella sp. GutDb-MelDb]PKG73211.1 collagenase-like protease [Shewanella sp. GutCb]
MRKIELLAPGGDIESIKAAIVAGADAVYCGLDNFNARKRAENLNFEQLCGLLRVAHQHHCELFLTLNIIVLEHELPALFKLLNQLVNTDIDGVIVQDLGVFDIISRYYPSLAVHASTQLTTHNSGQLAFLKEMGATRANLSRELDLGEITELSTMAHRLDMLTEVFVHGSNCIGFSGLCYFSSAHGGNSGNRGRCSQPCRDQYQRTDVGSDYPLNMKDNSAFDDLESLINAGVDSLKVEGRIKKSHYVYSVIDTWRQQLTKLQQQQTLTSDKTALYTVFNRDFTNGYLTGNVGKEMYIDNPRDNAVQHFSAIASKSDQPTSEVIQVVKQRLYDKKTLIIDSVTEQIKTLDISKPEIELQISGDIGTPLNISVFVAASDTPSFSVISTSCLTAADKYHLSVEELTSRFASLNSYKHVLKKVNCTGLASAIYLSFKELTQMKTAIVTFLNGNKALYKPIEFSDIRKQRLANAVLNTRQNTARPTELSVLIGNRKDLALYTQLKQQSSTEQVRFYYAVPDSIAIEQEKLIALFNAHPELTPWFGAIVLQADFITVAQLLKSIPQTLIATNNSGVGHIAHTLGVNWIAGPHLNTSNSFSLHSLKKVGCVGAFISNELNAKQIKAINPPQNFSLHYSALHPVLLMTSRQCLFLQSSGCDKSVMDSECLSVCKKQTTITNVKDVSFIIDKKRRDHNNLIGAEHFFNPDIIHEIPNKFEHILLDLRAIETQSQFVWPKADLVSAVKRLLTPDSNPEQVNFLKQALSASTRAQYLKGL